LKLTFVYEDHSVITPDSPQLTTAKPDSPPYSPPPANTPRESIVPNSPPKNETQEADIVSPTMATHTEVALPLPVLPAGWSAEKNFRVLNSLSKATQRNIEPVGPHFLAHARRARHKRTFSEDDRIQAQESVKKVEDDDAGEISEPEDPSMLLRDAKDWKVSNQFLWCEFSTNN
jgi:hypothetical protein